MDGGIILEELKRDIIENIISYLHPNTTNANNYNPTQHTVPEPSKVSKSNELLTTTSDIFDSLSTKLNESSQDISLQSPLKFDKTRTFASGNNLTAYIKD